MSFMQKRKMDRINSRLINILSNFKFHIKSNVAEILINCSLIN